MYTTFVFHFKEQARTANRNKLHFFSHLRAADEPHLKALCMKSVFVGIPVLLQNK